MIRYAFVFLLGVVLGSVVAVATTTFLAAQQPTRTAATSKGDSADGIGKSIEDAVTRALRRVEAEAVAARDSLSAPGDSDAASSSRPKSSRQRRVSANPAPVAPDADEPGATGAVTRDAATPLKEKDADRLQKLVVRSKNAMASRRRDWLFLSEAAVEKALGTPDHVVPAEDGSETWTYDVTFTNHFGTPEDATVQFTFNRGRVVEVFGADDFPE